MNAGRGSSFSYSPALAFFNPTEGYVGIVEFLQAAAANAVVLGIGGWLGKTWADGRLETLKGAQAVKLEEVKGEQNKSIEEMKGQISNINKQFQAAVERNLLVFKTHFDLEFEHYKDLWTDCDDAMNVAAQTLRLYDLEPTTTEAESEERDRSIERYDDVREALDRVRKKRPFISKDVADKAVELITGCVKIAEEYKDVFPRRNDEGRDRLLQMTVVQNDVRELRKLYDQVADNIAIRIKGMYVNESP